MLQNDTALIRLRDLAASAALLTRLPIRASDAAFARGAKAAWCWPLIGVLVGGIAGGAATVLLALGLPAPLAAGLCLVIAVMITGALHEDGLADTADGFWGGWEPERRLAIMKDSHIGSYGVIALILSLGLRWLALSVIFAAGLALPALVAVAVLSRATMPVMIYALPPAREGGLARSVGRVPFDTAVLGCGLAVVVGLLAAGLVALPLAGVAAAVAGGMGWLARVKIGGQTGDVLGATQQVSEIVLLCCFILIGL